ncbi:protein NYNRIN-like [Gossypium australe]|uniref:Protein NYNRIN-like n=1 Tax=Gossypium australe TaxID=47621 RepID=A0A5B6VA87_9ROSI|nr:protein NYNRIN-like [Gossypium australe]
MLEFDLWVMDRNGTKNQIADHLPRIEGNLQGEDTKEIKETFADEQLFTVVINQPRHDKHRTPSYADYDNYIA